MCPLISIRGCVHLSVCRLVHWSHTSWNHANVPFLTKTTISTSENASYAVYPALLLLDASTHLCMRLCPSVRPYVGPSVTCIFKTRENASFRLLRWIHIHANTCANKRARTRRPAGQVRAHTYTNASANINVPYSSNQGPPLNKRPPPFSAPKISKLIDFHNYSLRKKAFFIKRYCFWAIFFTTSEWDYFSHGCKQHQLLVLLITA